MIAIEAVEPTYSDKKLKEFETKLMLLAKDIDDFGAQNARHEANFFQLYEFKKVLFSQLMPIEGKNKEEKEKIVHTNKEYIAHVQAMCDAKALALESYAKLAGAKAKYESIKTILLKRDYRL
jgi:hypothetical protein